MIRPFLILVSMRPSKRNRVSNELGWSCIPSPLFGDAHAESWEIISANNVGLISRFSLVIEKLNPLGTLRLSWIECLERVALLFGKLDPGLLLLFFFLKKTKLSISFRSKYCVQIDSGRLSCGEQKAVFSSCSAYGANRHDSSWQTVKKN
jgi:hypothetical protein